ncbi:hypothetical protein D3C84_570230 [compost metagenome]
MDIAPADAAVEAPVAELRTTRLLQLGQQPAIGGIGRGFRQGHTDQRIELGQALARQLQAQVEGAQLPRVGQGTHQDDTGIAGLDLGLQGKRQVGILQRQQPAHLAAAVQRLALVTALGLPGEGVILGFDSGRPGAFGRQQLAEGNGFAQGIDQDVEAGSGLGVVHLNATLVEADGADVEAPARGLLLRAFRLVRQLEGPVVAAIGEAPDAGSGAAQFDARNAQLLPEQRQRRDTELDPLQADKIPALGPFRVAQVQLFGDEMGPGHQRPPAALPGLALPDHVQVALDGKRAAQLGGYPLVQRRLDAVPVEGGDQYQQSCQ